MTTADRVLEFIVEHVSEKGFPPTIREIGAAVGISSESAVVYQLTRLEDQGRISRVARIPRSIRVLDPAA